MNAPILWILLPLVFAVGLLLIARWQRLCRAVGSAFALLLTASALLLPVGEIVQLGIVSFEIQPSWVVLGRRFVIDELDRPYVLLIYLVVTFWFIGSLSQTTSLLFIPLGMALGGTLIAAIFIKPFYYGAILLLFAALLNIVWFVSDENALDLGIKRYWIFQTLAMPLLVLAGWLIGGTEANPGDIPAAALIYGLLLLGFSLLLSNVPFQSWLPAVAQRVKPYSFSLTIFLTPFTALVFVLTFLRQASWLLSSPWIVLFFSIQGFLMVILGGIGAIYHRHIGRWMGYALMKEIGLSLLLIGLGIGLSDPRPFFAMLFMQIVPRGLALALGGFAANLYAEQGKGLGLQQLVGIGRHYPVATLGYFLAVLTLVGFPLLASFPVHLTLWQAWFQRFPPFAFAAIFGSVGVLIGGLRSLAVLVRTVDPMQASNLESRPQKLLILVGSVLLLLMGVFPQWFLFPFYQMGLAFFR
ncbi:MAG: hypothetical protein DDG59_05840 [Anaerolineae bacterium]|nr:MAG: hypothetical protein DDG59_05840 [Anaerolineae bacterium]